MDIHATNYKINEQRFNERVAEFRESKNLATLTDEIALIKATIEDRLNAATTPQERAAALPMVRDLLGTLGNLTRAHAVAEHEAGRTLSKSTVIKFAHTMSDIVADELQKSGLEKWEDVSDAIASRLLESADGLRNERGGEK